LKSYFLNSSAFKVLSEEFIHAGAALRFTANGASMLPMIRDGDALLIKPVSPERIRRGDVLLFTCENGLPLVHRVTRRRKTGGDYAFWIEGDQALQPDGWIHPKNVIGRLDSLQRGSKTFRFNTLVNRALSLALATRKRFRLSERFRFGMPACFAQLFPICSEVGGKRTDA
jgi:signal peptidase I